MKKYISLFFIIILLISSLVACYNNQARENTKQCVNNSKMTKNIKPYSFTLDDTIINGKPLTEKNL